MYIKSAVFLFFLFLFSASLLAQPDKIEDVKSAGMAQQDKTEGSPFPFEFDDASDISEGKLAKQFFYAILLVILLGAACFYVTKKLAPKLAGPHGRQVKVVETVSIGSRRTIHLIEVGENKKVLIGSTPSQITLLTEIYSSLKEDEK